jgi:DNA-binding transcriptional MerR regulator/methylmalonyl-CoA mutase cobalamin-binding subunit
MINKSLYTIRYVSQRTGLTPHVIRAWEKRYQAVVPRRSPKNRRLYSEEEVQRLQFLKRLTAAGHNISQVAQLDSSDLLELYEREIPIRQLEQRKNEGVFSETAVNEHYNACLSAVLSLDAKALERSYDQAARDLTRPVLIEDLIVPLFQEIGNLWRNGSLKIVNEHMATSVTRVFLLNLLRAAEKFDVAPAIVVATTLGQWHDVGALTVALAAAENGWNPVYFGPNLPAEEIAAGVKQCAARAVAISVTHLLNRHALMGELRKLRRYIGMEVALFVGGRAVGNQMHVLEEIDAKHIQDMEQFNQALNSLTSAKMN